MTTSVAIVQNNFGRCGRTQVMARAIAVLNSHRIQPLVVTNQFRASQMVEGLDFDVRIVPPTTRGMFPTVDIALLNRVAARGNHSIIVNSNNTDLFLPPNKTISYVHFPLWSRLKKPAQLLSYDQVWRILLERMFFLTARWLSLRGAAPRATFFNSEFTRANAETAGTVSYPVPDAHTPRPVIEGERDLKKICYLGRFEKSKRQHEMIVLAAGMPDYRFVLCGFCSSERYIRSLQDLIQELGADNVELVVNAPQEIILELLATSGFYVHLKVFEPFGIGIVEALDMGCLPVVHDSGGAVEIVNNPGLRFSELSTINSIVLRARERRDTHLAALAENLTGMRRERSLDLFLTSLENILAEACLGSAEGQVQ